MEKVSYKIIIGSESFQSGKNQALLDLRTDASLADPVHTCRIRLSAAQTLKAKLKDPISIELGYGSSLQKVFTGQLTDFCQGHAELTLTGLSSFSALVGNAYNLVFEKSTAADLAKAVLSRAKVKTGKIENGLKFATYRMSETRSLYANLKALAQQCGFDFYADEQDKAFFKKHTLGAPESFTYGQNILGGSKTLLPSALDGVQVYGESPASKKGDKTSSWLTKKPVKGSSGKTSGHVLTLQEPTATTDSLAKNMAKNIHTAHQQKSAGKLHVLGAPKVALSGTIKTNQFPNTALNGTFKVVGISHRLNFKTGFTTHIFYEEAVG